MKAITFTTDGPTLADVPDPTPEADELLLQVEYCGICGTDLHAAQPDYHDGTVMGHEFSGTVLEAGRDVTGLREGDRVVVNPNGDWCGHCAQCAKGATNMCRNLWPNVIGLSRPGGLAARVAVRARTVHKLPDSVNLASAALVEPLAVALRTVRKSGFTIGEDAIVFGAGPIGLLVTTLLRAAGAANVTVVELSPARRELALRQGASEALDPAVLPVAERFDDPDAAPAFAFECTGIAELVGQAAHVIRPRGTLTVTGFSRRPPSFEAADLLFKEVTIRGNFIYVEEFAQAIQALATGTIDVTPLISGVVDVENATTAFDAMRTSPDAIKYLISAHHQR